jgi:hypothetical protein
MQKLLKFSTEKRSEWNVGDLVLHKKRKDRTILILIRVENDSPRAYTTIILKDLYSDNEHSMPLLFMDEYYINLGSTGKGFGILYGTKS